MITYAKGAAVLLAVVLLFAGGWYFRGLKAQAAAEAVSEAQSAAVAKAVLAERASGAAELTRVNTILKGYQDAPIDPVVPGIAGRLYKYEISSCAVPSTSPNPSGAVSPGPVPRGDPELERLSQAAFDAGAHDAKELTALQQVWSK